MYIYIYIDCNMFCIFAIFLFLEDKFHIDEDGKVADQEKFKAALEAPKDCKREQIRIFIKKTTCSNRRFDILDLDTWTI